MTDTGDNLVNFAPDPGEDGFQIGAVAQMTGLSVHNLRVWERRHAAVTPRRSGTRRRLYSREDVRRLSLLKTLVDAGQSISGIASLELSQLEDRVREVRETERRHQTIPGLHSPTDRFRIAASGNFIRNLLHRRESGLETLEFSAVFDNISELERLLPPGAADLAIVEVPSLFEHTLVRAQGLMERLNISGVLVLYRYSQQRTLENVQAEGGGIALLQLPADARQLRSACLALFRQSQAFQEPERPPLPEPRGTETPPPDSGPIPPRIFNDDQLLQVCKSSAAVQCECPQHLASLIFSLTAFEEYSAGCESQHEADAHLHAHLHAITAQARETIEKGLAKLIEMENIDL